MTDRSNPRNLGPDPYDPAVRRKNVKTLAIVVAVLIGAALIPITYRRVQAPEMFYATHAEAVSAQAVQRGDVPGFIPATATEIHARNNRDSKQRFVRFTFADAELPAITRGMRLLPHSEVEKLMVPTPGWSEWWPITSRTLSGGQGERLAVYEIASGADRGYLAIDVRTRYGYFWSSSAPRR